MNILWFWIALAWLCSSVFGISCGCAFIQINDCFGRALAFMAVGLILIISILVECFRSGVTRVNKSNNS